MTSAFGTQFTDKYSVAQFHDGQWSAYELKPLGVMEMHPAAHVLHYASSCFEGLKAYRREAGGAAVFRLDRHVERFRNSAELLCLPVPPANLVRDMIAAVVDAGREQIPEYPGSLYLRPVLYGTEQNIGAAGSGSKQAGLFVLGAPVGDYFGGAQKALRLLVEENYLRSAPHFGAAKTGGNYASALGPITRARREHNADQVLFCPGGEVQETGAANFMLINENQIVTRALDGAILHGVTRDSLLKLAPELGYKVTEKELTVDEMLEWCKSGEAVLSGTAAVLTSVGTLICRGEEVTVGDGKPGPNAARLRQALQAVHSGEAPDSFGWLQAI